MITVIEGYPDDVLAVSAAGHVTAEDYHQVLVPEAEARLARHDKVKMLFQLGEDFEGYSPGALWSDLEFGIGHVRNLGRVALVTDVAWVAQAARVFAPLFHMPFRQFRNADLAAARDWILAEETGA